MRRQLTRVTKRELTDVAAKRYAAASREKKKEVLDEHVDVTGY
jgi:hypothetical protein